MASVHTYNMGLKVKDTLHVTSSATESIHSGYEVYVPQQNPHLNLRLTKRIPPESELFLSKIKRKRDSLVRKYDLNAPEDAKFSHREEGGRQQRHYVQNTGSGRQSISKDVKRRQSESKRRKSHKWDFIKDVESMNINIRDSRRMSKCIDQSIERMKGVDSTDTTTVDSSLTMSSHPSCHAGVTETENDRVKTFGNLWNTASDTVSVGSVIPEIPHDPDENYVLNRGHHDTSAIHSSDNVATNININFVNLIDMKFDGQNYTDPNYRKNAAKPSPSRKRVNAYKKPKPKKPYIDNYCSNYDNKIERMPFEVRKAMMEKSYMKKKQMSRRVSTFQTYSPRNCQTSNGSVTSVEQNKEAEDVRSTRSMSLKAVESCTSRKARIQVHHKDRKSCPAILTEGLSHNKYKKRMSLLNDRQQEIIDEMKTYLDNAQPEADNRKDNNISSQQGETVEHAGNTKVANSGNTGKAKFVIPDRTIEKEQNASTPNTIEIKHESMNKDVSTERSEPSLPYLDLLSRKLAEMIGHSSTKLKHLYEKDTASAQQKKRRMETSRDTGDVTPSTNDHSKASRDVGFESSTPASRHISLPQSATESRHISLPQSATESRHISLPQSATESRHISLPHSATVSFTEFLPHFPKMEEKHTPPTKKAFPKKVANHARRVSQAQPFVKAHQFKDVAGHDDPSTPPSKDSKMSCNTHNGMLSEQQLYNQSIRRRLLEEINLESVKVTIAELSTTQPQKLPTMEAALRYKCGLIQEYIATREWEKHEWGTRKHLADIMHFFEKHITTRGTMESENQDYTRFRGELSCIRDRAWDPQRGPTQRHGYY